MIKRFLIVLPLVFLVACHQSDEQVITQAAEMYAMLNVRYGDIMAAQTDAEIVAEARRIGSCNLTFGQRMWCFLVGNDHIVDSGGVPLHAAYYQFDCDSGQINRHLNRLDSRMLTTIPLYAQLITMRENLMYLMRVVRGSAQYVEESRFIEMRRLKKEEVAEVKKQTRLLEEQVKKPVVVEETIVITEKKKPTHDAIEIDIEDEHPAKKRHVII